MHTPSRSRLDRPNRLGRAALALALAFACALLPSFAHAAPAEDASAPGASSEAGASISPPFDDPAASKAEGAPPASVDADRPATLAPTGADRPIVIFHTNDVHCGVDPTDKNGNVIGIGYAGLAAAVKQAKQTYGDDRVALVDAGDAVQGKPMGTLSKGAYLIDIMNKAGYDVATLGNHEFDYGMTQLNSLVTRASFPYVSCNFIDLRTGAPVFDRYRIIDYGGTKVAYVGIATPESLTKSSPVHFQDEHGNYLYGFCQDESGQALYNAVQGAVDDARAEGARYVVALGHLGETGITPRWRADAVIANTSGIDVFIDGHSHEQYEQAVANKDGKDVPLAQTGTQLQTFGTVVIDPAAGTITPTLTYPPADQDADMAAFVKAINDELDKTLKVKVAESRHKLVAVDSSVQKGWAVRVRETNLGNLVADSFRAGLGTDIALVNGGGIRSDVAAGDVTYGDAIAVQPFGSTLCAVEVTGQTLLDALEVSVRLYPQPSGGFLQPSGLAYEFRDDIPTPVKMDANGGFVGIEGQRRVQNVRVAGQPLDPAKTYRVGGTHYMLLEGGDGYTMFKGSRVILDEQGMDYEMLIEYLQKDLGGVVGDAYANPNGEGRVLVKHGPDPKPEPKPDPKPEPQPVPKPLAPTGDLAASQAGLAGAVALCALAGAAGARRALRRARPETQGVER